MDLKNKVKYALKKTQAYIILCLCLLIMGVVGYVTLYDQLLENMQENGISAVRSYASEEVNNLTVYETLVSYAVNLIDAQHGTVTDEEAKEAINLYFTRVIRTLGDNKVDPYVVYNGEIIAANPWSGDITYDYSSAEWYRLAQTSDNVVFTNVYTDVIYNKPVITIAQKCQKADAVVAFDIFPETFKFHEEPLTLPNADASFYLCDSKSTIIYMQSVLESRLNDEIAQYVTTLVNEIESGRLESHDSYIYDIDGNRRGVYYYKMSNGWYSILTISYDSILAELTVFSTVFISIFLLCLTAVLFIFFRDWKLNAQIERTNETVRVLGNSYYALYRIDYRKEEYEMIKGSDYLRERIPPHGKHSEFIAVAGEVIDPKAKKEFEESFSCESIRNLVSQRVRDFGGDFRRFFNGEYRWVNVRMLFDESLSPNEVILCFREVEQEKQREFRERELLENALENARRSEKTKQAFFSNMSHDMRTPLNAIIGMSKLAHEHIDEPEKIGGYLDKIHVSSQTLLDLVNDILDMSRIEQGKITLNYQETNLIECIDDCVAPFVIQAEAEGKKLEVKYDVCNRIISGDAFRINQIMNNLLSNAFKFTSNGDTVFVSVTQQIRENFSQYQIIVRDTGAGMSEEFLPLLFEPYARETRFYSKQISGTGLGMSIVKSLVTQMSGQITVESKLGKGTTFTITLPFATVNESRILKNSKLVGSDDSAQNISLKGMKILLAEDNILNMEIATEVLNMNEVEVVQAWNGEEALEIFKASKPFEFNVILMDMQMPQMDGCEASRRIRLLSRPDAKTIPIIAITANAFAEDIAATSAAGMNSHIPKPIDFGILCKTIQRLTSENIHENNSTYRRK